jgi:3-oxo-5alpha-steroid 4-dehydrogenase
LLAAGATAVAGTAFAPTLASAHTAPGVTEWDHEYDVVVIGFGVAGGAAAYEAASAGARVLVLDRGAAAANASHGSNVYLGGGTPIQQAYGVEDSPEEMEKFLLASQGPEPDRDKIRVYVEQNPGHYQWLIELGIGFSPEPADRCLKYSGGENVYPCTEMAKPAMRGHRHPSQATGKWIQRTLLEKVRASGATLILDADAEHLVQSDDGAIQGVIASVDGERRSFRATGGVVLASGGFAKNQEMVAQHAPLYLRGNPIDVYGNDGWGIRAGQKVGAAVRRLGAVCCFHAIGPPKSRYEGILVNANGQRFITEADVVDQHRLGDRIVREQRGRAYLIVDSRSLGERPPGLSRALGFERPEDEKAAEASTIAELERLLGIPELGLQQTVETYNRHAAEGVDPFFHKPEEYLRPIEHPPFTAVRASIGEGPFAYFTVGGLRTNAETRVLDHQGTPIPGFFAVGRVAAGILNYPYYLSGLSLGEGTLFGRIAGRTAAEQRGLRTAAQGG